MSESPTTDIAAAEGRPSRLELLEAFADGGETFARAVAATDNPDHDRSIAQPRERAGGDS